MTTALKMGSFAGPDWRGENTNCPSTEYPFFVYTLLKAPAWSVNPG